MRAWAFSTVFLVAPAICIAQESPSVVFEMGKFTSGEYTQQALTITNIGVELVEYVEIECGFFAGDVLVTASTSSISNIPPGKDAYTVVLVFDAPGADQAKCRISDIE